MGRKTNLRIRALEERRRQKSFYTHTNFNNKQKKSIQEYDNQCYYPTGIMFEDGSLYGSSEDYGGFYDPFGYGNYDDFCNPFNHTGYTDSESSSNDENRGKSQGLEDVDIEALEEGDETSGVTLKLPFDIFLDILSRLPISPLARCRCVCKTWRKIVHHPRFTSMHHDKVIKLQKSCDYDSDASLLLHKKYSEDGFDGDIYLLEHDTGDSLDNVTIVKPRFYPSCFDFEVVGSCNGLLCLSEQFYYDPVYICNPVIGEYFKLPEASKLTNFDIVSGFGYDQDADEYKVVRMLFDSIDYVSEGNVSFKLEAEVYTLGTGIWRKIGCVPYPLCGKSSLVFVNGFLHWMTDEYVGSSVSERIISFDVSKEKFHPVPPPPGLNSFSEALKYKLGDLRRCLCLFDFSSNDQFDIWVMKNYGIKDSWTKEYVISRQELGLDRLYIHPLKMMRNGEMLLEYDNKLLICYDPRRRSVRKLGIHKLPLRFEAITHVGSFISLRDIVGPSTSKGSVTKRRWYRTLYPLPSDNPELEIEDWILDHEVQQLAALLDSGSIFSDPYLDW